MDKIASQKSLKVNFLMNALLSASSFIFPLISFPYASRILGPEGTGLVAFCYSIVCYFNMFAQLGVPLYGIRKCAAVRDDKVEFSRTVQEIFLITLASSLVSYIALFAIIGFADFGIDTKLITLIMSAYIILNTLGMEWVYRSLEEYTYITVRSLVAKVIALVALFALVHSQNDTLQYGIVTILAAAASNIWNLVNLRKHVIFKPLGNYSFRQHLKPIFMLFATTCAVAIYTSLDAVILGILASNVEVGYYDAAMRIRRILTALITSLGAVLLPRASYYLENNQIDAFVSISKKAFGFVFYAALPVGAFTFFFSQPIILALAGEAYVGAIVPLRVLSFVVLLVGLSNISGTQMLVSLKMEKEMCYSSIAAGVVDLGLVFALTRTFGAVGASIAALCAELTILLVQLHFLRSRFVASALLSIPTKPILGTLCSIICGCITQYCLDGAVFQIIIGGVVFFAVYYVVTFFLKDPFATEVVSLIKKVLDKALRKSS